MIIEKLLKVLKPTIASFGYNQKEIRGIAEALANNPTLTEDATEDDINAAIDAVIPYLKIGQQQANRIASKPAPPSGNDPKESVTQNPEPEPKPTDEPEWARAMREQNEAILRRLSAIDQEKTTKTRHERLSQILDGCGAMGEATLKAFSRMQFKDEDDFESYVAEVEETAKTYIEREGKQSLSKMTVKPGGNKGANKNEEEPTEEELDALSGILR